LISWLVSTQRCVHWGETVPMGWFSWARDLLRCVILYWSDGFKIDSCGYLFPLLQKNSNFFLHLWDCPYLQSFLLVFAKSKLLPENFKCCKDLCHCCRFPSKVRFHGGRFHFQFACLLAWFYSRFCWVRMAGAQKHLRPCTMDLKHQQVKQVSITGRAWNISQNHDPKFSRSDHENKSQRFSSLF
jgi:hypothetical protein